MVCLPNDELELFIQVEVLLRKVSSNSSKIPDDVVDMLCALRFRCLYYGVLCSVLGGMRMCWMIYAVLVVAYSVASLII